MQAAAGENKGNLVVLYVRLTTYACQKATVSTLTNAETKKHSNSICHSQGFIQATSPKKFRISLLYITIKIQ